MEKELLELLQTQDYEEAAEIANKYTSEELAAVLKELDKADIPAFCRALDSDLLADALLLLDSDLKEDVINGLRDDELEAVLDEMSVDETVDIIEDMPQEIIRRIAETEEILMLLSERNFSVLRPLIASMNAIDLAEVFNEIRDESELHVLFRILPKDLAAETFVEMDSDVKETLISKLNDRELRAIMDELFLDDTVDIIEEMPASVVKRVLAQSDN